MWFMLPMVLFYDLSYYSLPFELINLIQILSVNCCFLKICMFCLIFSLFITSIYPSEGWF